MFRRKRKERVMVSFEWGRFTTPEMHRAGHKATSCCNGIYIFYMVLYDSILIRTLDPGDSMPSAFRLPSTESGVAVRA